MKDIEELVKADYRDVLLGRGKKIIVNKFRLEYINAVRDRKVAIATRVINIIHDNGGRFLEERGLGKGEFYVVSQARAIEKCCQALREKEQSNPPEGDPFENIPTTKGAAPKPPKIPPKKGKKSLALKMSKKSLKLQLKKQARKSDCKTIQSSPEGSDRPQDSMRDAKLPRVSPVRSLLPRKGDSEIHAAHETKARTKEQTELKDSTDQTDQKEQKLKKEKKDDLRVLEREDILLLMESPTERLKALSADVMLKRLHLFIQEHQHAAVPPGWPFDPDLADWCTFQRQSVRMARKGYTELGPDDKKLIADLSSLNFVWDYGDWQRN